MKRLILLSAILFSLLPQSIAAQTPPSMFDLYFEEAKDVNVTADLGPIVTGFVIEEMKEWNGHGILLSEADITMIREQGIKSSSTLCTKKTTAAGLPISFSYGDGSQQGSCMAMQKAVMDLLNAEREATELGSDLLAASNGSELAIADEPHRPVPMGKLSLLLRRVWSGAGESLIPWDGSADTAIAALEAVLHTLPPHELDIAVTRYHFGHFRDIREADPRLRSPSIDAVGVQMQNIADILGVTGDPSMIGEFAAPTLKVGNVGIWIRKDDLGLQWVYPAHQPRISIKRAGAYPVMVAAPGAHRLAYPFEFAGAAVPADPRIASPLCSRTVGRYGYLCRRVPLDTPDCANTHPGMITLAECTKTVTETDTGPAICTGLENLYQDTGISFTDPQNPARINPALQLADPATICSPDTKIVYRDDISSHACYVGLCLAQSMNGHSLIPNRNPVVTNETTSPYQSCMRNDPQLGLYSEAASASPFPLPTYRGHLLTQHFERAYCLKSGDSVRPVLGDCSFKSDTAAAELPVQQQEAVSALVKNTASVAGDQDSFLSLAVVIGQRASQDQLILVEKKLYASLTQFIREMAGLLLELKRAPVTQTACSQTGPFPAFGL